MSADRRPGAGQRCLREMDRDRLWSRLPDHAQVPIRTRVVSTWQDAERLGFVGSPTVRIEGEDPFSSAGRPVGLSCRVYRSEGARSQLPELRELRRALKRHADVGS